MRTYFEIQELYRSEFGVTLKTCWIADVKRKLGLTKRVAPNRISRQRVKYPCPPGYFEKIKKLLIV
jgi:hypothetical protein